MHLNIYTIAGRGEKLSLAAEFAKTAEKYGFDCTITDDVSQTKNCDLLVVVGGDGTILNVSEEAAKFQKPILSVNNGRMGFLTEVEICEFEEALKCIKAGNCQFERRMMLQVDVQGKTFNALNEMLIVKEKRSSIGRVEVRCENILIDVYEGDGVIISTPTGSTGYSLSAGGPILSPHINALVLTPLCVHSLHNRPVIFAENEQLEITVQSRGDDNSLYIDGKEVLTDICNGTKLTVKKSDFSVDFLRINKSDFYDKLYKKLVQWNNFKKG